MTYENLSASDPEVFSAISDELRRQRSSIELIASENFVSLAVMEAVGSPLTNKYAEGLPGKRYYGGCWAVDKVEDLARERAKRLFGAGFANVQPHSGAQANYAALAALAQPGDTILGMALDNGGHLTHGSPANFSGKLYNVVSYGVDAQTERIDMDAVEALAREHQPKVIIAGASAYPRIIDFERFAQIAHSVGAYLMVDMAHIAGLVATGRHPSPVPHADVVTTTTHKTLRGPRGGLILCNDPDLAKKVDSAVFPGSQGGPLEHVIAGKAVAFGEALRPDFAAYAQIYRCDDGEGCFFQIMKNMASLSPGTKVCFTFDSFPRIYPDFYKRVKKTLKLLENKMGVPADIEFAFEPTEDSFCLIQSRPFWSNNHLEGGIPELSPKQILLQADRMVTHGAIPQITKIVYIDFNRYYAQRDFYGTARLIGELNKASDGEPYILVAPGRIGSSNPELGVPVQYSELTNCRGMVELGIPRLGFMPELSYGTHFFSDLEVDGVLYMPVFAGEDRNIFNADWFESKKWEPWCDNPAIRVYRGSFAAYMDGETNRGVIVDKDMKKTD